jgi:hypothetical protein
MTATNQNIQTAFIAARMEMEAPVKSAVNPHFHSRYAPLEELVRVTFGPLAKYGLMLSQNTRAKDGRMVLETRILSADASLEFGDYDLGQQTNQQAMGSAVTYARRYTIAAIFGLAAEDDDDGNAASAPQPKPAAAAKPSAEKRSIHPDRASLEKEYMDAWKSTRTEAQLANSEDWKNRGVAVKTILGLDRFIKVSDMTDEQLKRCIAEWTGGAVNPDSDIPF